MEKCVVTPIEFGRLFVEYRDKFVSIAFSYIHDRASAEDIVADSFTRFWDMRESIVLTGPPQAYILASVRNRCLNYLRDKANRMRIEQSIQDRAMKIFTAEINSLASKELDWLFNSEIEETFTGFVASMPEERKSIFLASRKDGLTYNEIALRFGFSPRKVRREISKALESLRQVLKYYI